MRSLLVATLLLLAGPSRAWAQYEYPPPYALQPPTPEQIAAMQHAARHKIIAGNALIVSGSVLAVAGTGLVIAGIYDDNGTCHTHYHDTNHYYYDGYYTFCGNDALVFAGGATTFLGAAMIVPGAFLLAGGRRDLAAANALARSACCSFSLRPKVSTHGALAELAVGF